MTLKQFKHDMIRGLGTCIIELENSNDISQYKSIVLFGCLNTISYEHQIEGTRSRYMYELIKYFNDDSYFENSIICKFKKNLKSVTLIVTLIERLAYFAGNGSDKAKQILYEKYEYLIHKNNITHDNGIVLDWLCVNLLQVYGYKFLKYHIETVKQMKKYIEEDHLGWFYYSAIQRYKEKAGSLLKSIHPHYDNKPEFTFEQNDFSFQNIFNHLMDENFFIRFNAFSFRADELEIKKAINFLIEDGNVIKKKRLLRLLSRKPIDHNIGKIIEMIGKYPDNLDKIILEYCSNIPNNNFVKRLGYSLLEERSTRSFGLQMIINSYKSSDKESVIYYTKKLKIDYDDIEYWYDTFSALLNLIYSKKKDVPIELLQYIFNETLNSYQREYVIDIMKRKKIQNMNILYIAKYDSDYDVVKKAKKLIERIKSESSGK